MGVLEYQLSAKFSPDYQLSAKNVAKYQLSVKVRDYQLALGGIIGGGGADWPPLDFFALILLLLGRLPKALV